MKKKVCIFCGRGEMIKFAKYQDGSYNWRCNNCDYSIKAELRQNKG